MLSSTAPLAVCMPTWKPPYQEARPTCVGPKLRVGPTTVSGGLAIAECTPSWSARLRAAGGFAAQWILGGRPAGGFALAAGLSAVGGLAGAAGSVAEEPSAIAAAEKTNSATEKPIVPYRGIRTTSPSYCSRNSRAGVGANARAIATLGTGDWPKSTGIASSRIVGESVRVGRGKGNATLIIHERRCQPLRNTKRGATKSTPGTVASGASSPDLFPAIDGEFSRYCLWCNYINS